MKQISFLLLVAIISLASCNSQKTVSVPNLDKLSQQTQDDVKKIQEYIKTNKLKNVQATESGLHYIVTEEGTGDNPSIDDQVTVHYKGYLLDGSVFDSSFDRGQPATFPLKGVVKGWQEGIPKFKPGGKGQLFIPSEIAYGSQAKGNKIPANSVLVFDIELKEIVKVLSPAEQLKIDEEKIEAFVKEKGLKNVQKTESGIRYIIEKEGTGANPTIDDKVKVHYKGTLLDGSEFDSSYARNQPAEFPLKGVVKGWQEGIPLIKTGGKGKLIIPSGLAYGSRGRPSIPANSVLIFDVELLDITTKK